MTTTFLDFNSKASDAMVRMAASPDGDDIAELAIHFAALCDPFVVGLQVKVWAVGPNTGEATEGTYGTVRDLATLTFTDTAGSIVKVTLVGPSPDIFEGDARTVDPTDVLVADFISFALSALKSPAGLDLAEYVSGVRWYFNP